MKFKEQIDFIRKTGAGIPRSLNIDLAIPLTDFEYAIAANLFYVIAAPDGISYIDVKFNRRDESSIRFFQQVGLVTPFEKIYITTPAGQTGNMTILYGVEAPELLEVIDNRSATSADLAQIRNELQGDTAIENWGTEITVGNAAAVVILAANADRKGAVIQSKDANGGLVYIGVDNTVATNKWIAELQAGMSFSIDDYRGPLWARASAVGQLVGYGEF